MSTETDQTKFKVWARICSFAGMLLLASSLWSFGCAGGGTSGTGLTRIAGNVALEDGVPLDGANVIFPELAVSAVTDSRGDFEVDSPIPNDQIPNQLLITIEDQGFVDSAAVNLNSPNGNIMLEVVVSAENKRITSVSASRPTPTPRPTKVPTIANSPKPTRTPKVKPTREPTPSPNPMLTGTPKSKPGGKLPTPTPTITPTETPGITPTPTVTPTQRPRKTPKVRPTPRPKPKKTPRHRKVSETSQSVRD